MYCTGLFFVWCELLLLFFAHSFGFEVANELVKAGDDYDMRKKHPVKI